MWLSSRVGLGKLGVVVESGGLGLEDVLVSMGLVAGEVAGVGLVGGMGLVKAVDGSLDGGWLGLKLTGLSLVGA